MKLLRTSAVVIGIALCLAACSKSPTQNSVDENAANAAEAPATAPAATAPAANVTDVNAAAQNSAGASATTTKHRRKGDRTDNGPRPPAASTN